MRRLFGIGLLFAAISWLPADAAQQTWPSAYGSLGGQGYTTGNFISTNQGGQLIDSGQNPASIKSNATTGVTDGSSAPAGIIGEVLSVSCPNSATKTATFTNGSATIGITTTPPIGCPINFTTTGGLPTNFAVGTNYYVVSRAAGVSVTVAAAPAGTAILAGSAGTGTQTAVYNALMTSTTTVNLLGVSLTAGDWRCNGVESWIPGSGTTSSLQQLTITATGADGGTAGALGNTILGIAFPASTAQTIPVGSEQILISVPTEIFLNSTPTFAVSTAAADGAISCRRMH